VAVVDREQVRVAEQESHEHLLVVADHLHLREDLPKESLHLANSERRSRGEEETCPALPIKQPLFRNLEAEGVSWR
jgi:hypothetical protein